MLFSLLILVSISDVRPSAREERAVSFVDSVFTVRFSPHGLESLMRTGDLHETEYILPGRSLGVISLRYRVGKGAWRSVSTANLQAEPLAGSKKRGGSSQYAISHTVKFRGRGQIQIAQLFTLQGDSLSWRVRLRNLLDNAIEVGDLSLPLPFNNRYGEDGPEIFERRVIRHQYIGGGASFLYWLRPSGIGPYLLLTPMPGTGLEFFDLTDQGKSEPALFSVYVHAGEKAREDPRGTWRQPLTTLKLRPGREAAGQKTYGFNFRWAPDYDAVRTRLYDYGLVDVQVVPGMTIPTDLRARIAVRSRRGIDSLTAEYPHDTRIESHGPGNNGYQLFDVLFRRLGENLLTVHYGAGESMPLEFFATEPLEILIKKRASFLAVKQQHRDPSVWYNGLFSQWDMRNRVLRGPDDPDGFLGWWGYVLACDDPALCKAPFLAAKNLRYPDRREIRAIEYYINNYLWGRLQYTERDTPYPYGIFGVPNWYENRRNTEGRKEKGEGVHHVWRTYDYPHVVMLYFHMYQIAKMYPHLLDQPGRLRNLERAYGTAMALFTVPQKIFPVHEAIRWASYNELMIPQLIDSLEAEGFPFQADTLRREWERKVKYFIYDDPYPYRSEYNFDATAFESTQAFASYALAHPLRPDTNLWFDTVRQRWCSHPEITPGDARAFMARQMAANLACRGVLEPAYYTLGSDYRGESARYLLSYMSQMGGWAILDYALRFSDDPAPFLRLGYASTLSSWALMNTGTAESAYGYWYPGLENDGAAGWAFEPQKSSVNWIRKEQGRGAWFYDGEIDLGYGGALRAAATIFSQDPIFGPVTYGGKLVRSGDTLEVVPRDGVRQRFHIVRPAMRFSMILDRDGYALERSITVHADLTAIRFLVENRSADAHITPLHLTGLPAGTYIVAAEHGPFKFSVTESERTVTTLLSIGPASETSIAIVRQN